MAAANRTKTSDKQAVGKKLIALLKKHYKTPPPKGDRPVLETMLYGVCLENVSTGEADKAYGLMASEFHDLNEIRVSSVSELEVIFIDTAEAEWKAFQLRGVLQYVFEKNYAYEFEALRKKTQELAVKQLAKIRSMTPFVRAYTLNSALGSHVLPVDRAMARALAWLGMTEPEAAVEDVSESLRPIVRKADAALFCHLLRSLATDPALRAEFETADTPPEEGFDLHTAPERLAQLLKDGPKGKSKPRSAAAKPAAKGASSREKASAGAKKTPPKKLSTKKTLEKKGAANGTKKPARKSKARSAG